MPVPARIASVSTFRSGAGPGTWQSFVIAPEPSSQSQPSALCRKMPVIAAVSSAFQRRISVSLPVSGSKAKRPAARLRTSRPSASAPMPQSPCFSSRTAVSSSVAGSSCRSSSYECSTLSNAVGARTYSVPFTSAIESKYRPSRVSSTSCTVSAPFSSKRTSRSRLRR